MEYFNESSSNDPNVVLDNSNVPAVSWVEQQLYWWQYRDSGQNYYNIRQTGYFVPPFDGDYQFFVQADDKSVLYLSMNGTREGLVSNEWQ